jgi:hypothetical protein
VKNVFWMLVAIVALTAATGRLLGSTGVARSKDASESCPPYVDYRGNPYPDFAPLRPTSRLSEATRRYKLVSRDGGPVTVTFGARYFEDVMAAPNVRYPHLPAEVEREKGATFAASGTLFEVGGFDRLDPRLVTGRLLAPDLSGRRIPWTVCVARKDLAPL